MLKKLRLRIALVSAALFLSPTLVAPSFVASAHAETSALTCRASMSDSTPKQYSNVYVRVRTAAYAKVRTVARYKTTNTVKRGTANSAGRANIRYYISGATPGYRVRVNVTVTKNGRTSTCTTSFVPHR